jgi:hypothetical protein
VPEVLVLAGEVLELVAPKVESVAPDVLDALLLEGEL